MNTREYTTKLETFAQMKAYSELLDIAVKSNGVIDMDEACASKLFRDLSDEDKDLVYARYLEMVHHTVTELTDEEWVGGTTTEYDNY